MLSIPSTGPAPGDAAPGSPDFAELRRREFGRLDRSGHVYLDYTGSALYTESQVRAHHELLLHAVLGNPHSESPASRASTWMIEEARAAVLRFFDADPDEYTVCFTANATGALRLVGEAFPFGAGSRLVLSRDNHNSVNGIREHARVRGAEVRYVPLDAELRMRGVEEHLPPVDPGGASLFAYPAQSNFSGVKHPLEWTALARERGYAVLLDAAALVPTAPLRLREVAPDYVCVSFYKMFGYPTGVGALVARREALERLRRPSFAGGTVQFVSTQHPAHLLRRGAEGFEDGTPSFLGIDAVPTGLEFLERVGIERLGRHVARLTALVLEGLRRLEHPDGAPRVRVYGPRDLRERGGTVAFNLLDPRGRPYDHGRVVALAGRAGISLRGGCFCNPGAAESALGFPSRLSAACFAEQSRGEAFSLERFSACMGGAPVGAVRVSLGLPSNEEDVRRFLAFLEEIPGTGAGVGLRLRAARSRRA